jgi:hypothetical protein
MTDLTRHACAAGDFRLERNPGGRLVLIDELGIAHVGVEPVRSFPVSDPDRLISLLDNHGRELTCITDLAALPRETRDLIRQELADREFLPKIERVVQVNRSKEPHIWEVITDRGPTQFLMREDDIRRLSPTQAILVDVHGVRFFIPDSRQLDAKSRRILSQLL